MLVKVLFVFLLVQLARCTDYSNGFGEAYDWKSSLADAKAEGERTEKPMLVIFHAPWCSMCQTFKGEFIRSDEIKELSKDFVFVNVRDSAEPKDQSYAPDGYYYPRVLFVCKSKVMPDIINNSGSSKYKYNYVKMEDIAASMRKALVNCV